MRVFIDRPEDVSKLRAPPEGVMAAPPEPDPAPSITHRAPRTVARAGGGVPIGVALMLIAVSYWTDVKLFNDVCGAHGLVGSRFAD